MPSRIDSPHSVLARMSFLADCPRYRTEKPCVVVPPTKVRPVEHANQPNATIHWQDDVRVEDVRDWKDQLSLDVDGFEILDHESAFMALDSQEVCAQYKAEVEDVLTERLGAERVITWTMSKRKENHRLDGEELNSYTGVEVVQPATVVHCDFTYERGRVMVEQFLGVGQTQSYIDNGYRIRIINTWRPLIPIIDRQPLAFCDPRTVDPGNLIKTDRILARGVGEITLLQYRPEQKWYFLHGQKSHEPYIFCTWDSEDVKFADVVRHSPHVSFDHDGVREDAPPRFSIESRSIVVTKP